jgi:O-antigen/teichoic acid export membrane protein
MSRLEKSAKNIALTMGSNILDSILGVVSRTVFIQSLGSAYLGLAGLLGNILGLLSITELGIASAIGFSLYKPLATGDDRSVSALMSLYRKAYRIIAVIVFVCGIGLYFFLDFFVPPEQQPPEIGLAYFVYLANTVLGYLLSYKLTLLTADNHGYRLASLTVGMSVVQTVTQVVCLLLFKSYTVYLAVLLLCSAVRMIIGNRLVTKWYPKVDFRSREKLDTETSHQIKRNIGGLVIAKIGDYLVNSTDNLIITKLVSLTATGIYSNYLMIRNMVNGYISVLFGGISASMGNVVAVESDERKKEIFDTLMFCAYFIYSFEAVCFMCLFNPFIGEIWLGPEYTFDTLTVAIIVINNFLTGLRIPLITMKGAAGKYMEDAWVPFAFAVVNLVASIILAKYMGVAGVFLGTIIGSLCTADWYRPIVIYKHVFHAPVRLYYKRYISYVILGLCILAGTYWICGWINTSSVIVNFILKGITAGGLPILLNAFLFHRTKEFSAVLGMGQHLWDKLRHFIHPAK